jgi:H+/Cl- antiporter ClcA
MLAAWWLVKRYAKYAGGSGIPQVMTAIDLVNQKSKIDIKPLLSIKVGAVKIISSILMVLGGGAVGREGPTIQLSSIIFDYFNRMIPDNWARYKRTSMIVAGAAAGLAAAFNTPLGGIVFAIEELSKVHVRFYRSALFSAVIISGITAQGFLGSYLYLGYPSLSGTSWFMFGYIVLVAVLGGFLGGVMGKWIIKIIRWRRKYFKTSSKNIAYIIIISIIFATLAYFVSFSITGSGKEIMQNLLFSKKIVIEWYDFPLRFIGTLLSFSSGAAGGIFAPALSGGAA